MGLFSRKKKAQKKLHIKGFPGHVDTCKCLYLAAEKGLDIDLSLLDITEQEQQQDSYLSMSPFGKVPSLSEDTQVVSGVAAVLPFIDIKGGGKSLTPKKAANLGQQNYRIEVVKNKVMPPLDVLDEEQLLNAMKDST